MHHEVTCGRVELGDDRNNKYGSGLSFSVLTVVFQCTLFALKGTSVNTEEMFAGCQALPILLLCYNQEGRHMPFDDECLFPKTGGNSRWFSTKHQSLKIPEPSIITSN
ncbi:hypothetical protein GOODEAATRI_006721 [Goodea atripinnis]|uniref:Uncharacterized protein n=1 Tax=Goodea atripinnis TaxID=208336 RepID=A0ABV0N8H3_9TELE